MDLDRENTFVTLDEIIPYIGEFQRFQWLLGALFCMFTFPATYPRFIMSFAAKNPDWRCVANSTLCLSNETFSADNDLRCNLSREDWEFTEPKHFSIVTWFDIYCNSWMIELSSSIFFVGMGVGGLLVGWVTDNFGRKNVIFLSNALSMICGLVAAFASNIYVFVILRFVIGVFLSGTTFQMCTLLSEIVASSYRPLAGTLVWVSFTVALCVLSLKAYLIRNWQILFAVCSAPYVILLLFYKFCPESPRWLRLKGKSTELMETLQRISRANKKVIPSHLSILPVDDEMTENQSSNLLRLFRTRKFLKIPLVIGYGYFAHGLVYYGIHMAASGFGTSLYLSFFLLSFVDLLGTIASIYLCDRFGRKRPTIIGVFIAAVLCIVVAFLPDKKNTLRVIVGLLGKTAITISFNTFNVWSIEAVPTIVRGQSMGFNSFCARLGSGASPWVAIGLAKLHYSAPYICMGAVAVLCSISSLFLFETKSFPTLETFEDLDSITTAIEDHQPLDEESYA